LADDTTLFLKNTNSLKIVFKTLDQFQICSGLKLNKTKTQIFYLGNTNHRPDDNIFGVHVCNHVFKVLGIYFIKDNKEMIYKNLEERFTKFKTVLGIWSSRDLSLKGKITILKSLAIPQLLYTTCVLFTPAEFIQKVEKEISKFVWSNKPPKIRNVTMIGSIDSGGIKMPCFATMIKTQKSMWIKRLLCSSDIKWKRVALKLINMKQEHLLYKLDKSFIPKQHSAFYEQILNYWFEFYSTEPTVKNIFDQCMWNNKYVLISNKPINIAFNSWEKAGIKYIRNICDSAGNYLSQQQLNSKYNIVITVMQYNSLLHAIPRSWKEKIKLHVNSDQAFTAGHLETKTYIDIHDQRYLLDELRSKIVYMSFIVNIQKPPVALEKWISSYPFLNSKDFALFFKLPYKTTLSTKAQTFQYKVINRILATQEKQFKWKLNETPYCEYCKEIETLEHLFFTCSLSNKFWLAIKSWLKCILQVTFSFHIVDILFGIPFGSETELLYVNFIILYGKMYLYSCKFTSQKPDLLSFILELKQHVQLEHHIECIKSQANNKWDEFYHSF
jgi:hypothetical protein